MPPHNDLMGLGERPGVSKRVIFHKTNNLVSNVELRRIWRRNLRTREELIIQVVFCEKNYFSISHEPLKFGCGPNQARSQKKISEGGHLAGPLIS